MMKTLVVIPARYASTRFPGKPLALLGGKPIVQWVWERVQALGADIVIATDDDRIAKAAEERFHANVLLTSPDCQSGTDRCGEVLRRMRNEKGERYDIVVNVQGDEPFVDLDQLQALTAAFDKPSVQIATLRTRIAGTDELLSPNNVKVVCADNGNALYFSRQPIPYRRDTAQEQWLVEGSYYKHVGLYAYRAEVLEQLCQLPVGTLEASEKLEQLRWLSAGYTIRVIDTPHANIGIDTPEDLAEAENILNRTK